MKNEYNIIIEQDTDGYYVGYVPKLKECHSQAKSIDQLIVRMKEVIELCLQVKKNSGRKNRFVGIQKIFV
ncbi:MAG: type II toxin-antitoxin system HicB family antitoxin [Ignavibacteria bacterium]|nr:type II toxin-antitoxin system HicB family antitoxin [Ignavibacteria bacterium]